METQLIYEIIGYGASVLVAASLTMRSILRLRIINLAGSITFTVYGILIGAIPVAAVNAFIVFVNLYYLYGMRDRREYFKLLEVRPDSPYLAYFLSFYEEQIRRFVPGFAGPPREEHLVVFVLRDLVPAGLFIGELRQPDTLVVKLDFAIPQYRDSKIGRYLFVERAEEFRARGIRQIVSAPGNETHTRYLKRMGFEPTGPDGEMRLLLAEG
jgi:hypothetical protein